jgi:hypothetical protein
MTLEPTTGKMKTLQTLRLFVRLNPLGGEHIKGKGEKPLPRQSTCPLHFEVRILQGEYPIQALVDFCTLALTVDVPASAVLLVLYLGLGLHHAYCFFKLSSRTFVPQAMVMGFCYSRVVTMAMRIVWTENLDNKSIAIAANVFINAGLLIIVHHS